MCGIGLYISVINIIKVFGDFTHSK